QGHDLRSLGETVGGLAHNFNNSLAAILAYTELLLRDAPKDSPAHRRLMIVRDVALEASATVRRLQDFVARQPEVAFGPVAPRARSGCSRRRAIWRRRAGATTPSGAVWSSPSLRIWKPSLP